MRHRLEWFIHLRAEGLSKGDEHLANTTVVVWYSLPLPLYRSTNDHMDGRAENTEPDNDGLQNDRLDIYEPVLLATS